MCNLTFFNCSRLYGISVNEQVALHFENNRGLIFSLHFTVIKVLYRSSLKLVPLPLCTCLSNTCLCFCVLTYCDIMLIFCYLLPYLLVFCCFFICNIIITKLLYISNICETNAIIVLKRYYEHVFSLTLRCNSLTQLTVSYYISALRSKFVPSVTKVATYEHCRFLLHY